MWLCLVVCRVSANFSVCWEVGLWFIMLVGVWFGVCSDEVCTYIVLEVCIYMVLAVVCVELALFG